MTHLVVVGGSDAGIAAALRAREIDPNIEVSLVLADEYPNFSICGIPYWISGDVAQMSDLAHRTRGDLEDAGIDLLTSTRALEVEPTARRLRVRRPDGREDHLGYDELLIGTGAQPRVASHLPVGQPGVHVLHTMTDARSVMDAVTGSTGTRAVVVGAGYIGLEMVEGLVARGFDVTLLQRGSEVLSTLDPHLGVLVADELRAHGVRVVTNTTVDEIVPGATARWVVRGSSAEPTTPPLEFDADLVVVSTGVEPVTDLALAAGARAGHSGAIIVDEQMRTGVPHLWAAGDCVVTHHRLLGTTWLPLGTTAHKQGRVAGENMIGGNRRFAGSVGTQVVKVFDLVAARTGLRDHEATVLGGVEPVTRTTQADDHKAYYPGAVPLTIAVTGNQRTGGLLGAQIVGRRTAEVSKRIDIYAAALHSALRVDAVSDLDLSYTPPLGSPWDAVQMAAHAWQVQHERHRTPTPQPTR